MFKTFQIHFKIVNFKLKINFAYITTTISDLIPFFKNLALIINILFEPNCIDSGQI
ncbi:MAG: hypothetical protein ACD_30C00072G0002 [uncultured bacterium]|uniref:Uncharacterized protein n=1 Tax=Candidatus Daviesbacteria bacterium GW2011_GWA1_36_8 TaxID=1618417 RepID=A0A0G0HR47_9BACT|nr:MAG: hypothetical protein ACD_30C00072G0002 [uncultured bacterium]KKQ14529.1 MAG: hypothetical protein US28_C0034G0002 [Candidatus Daviesbacteria bacterium GW2011_GWA1_36_8]